MLKYSELIYTFLYNIYIYIQYADIYGIVAVTNSNVVWPALNAYGIEHHTIIQTVIFKYIILNTTQLNNNHIFIWYLMYTKTSMININNLANITIHQA